MGERFLVASKGGEVLAARVRRADGPVSRAVGLLNRSSLAPGEGLWLEPCAMVHTLFMRFSIDVVFLGRDLEVRRVVRDLKPWRLSPWVPSARSALELAAGASPASLKAGDRLSIR